jgi:hypothetical protein
MSDDLVSKMKAAADAAIQSATPAESSDGEAEASADESLEAAPEQDEAAAEEPTDGEEPSEEVETETAEPEPADDDDVADQILAVRQAAERKVRSAESKVRELESKLQRAGEYIEQSKKQVVEEIFKKLRRAPARTFQEFGFEFQDLIDAGMREGQFSDGPMNEIDELRQEMRAIKEDRERARQEQEHQASQRQMMEAKQSFLGLVSKNAFPTLYSMFEDSPGDLWNEALAIAESHSERTGQTPSDIQVVKYLEQKYAAKMKRLGVAPASAASAAPKKAMAKTLSTKAASETRTAGKPFGQLDADQQKAALLAAVKKATTQAAN